MKIFIQQNNSLIIIRKNNVIMTIFLMTAKFDVVKNVNISIL